MLFLIRPHVLKANQHWDMLKDIEAAGFAVMNLNMTIPTKVQLIRHYAEHKGQPYYDKLIASMFGQGNLIAGTVYNENIEENKGFLEFRKLVGPHSNRVEGTLRHKYAIDDLYNGIHASDSYEAMQREFPIWFGRL